MRIPFRTYLLVLALLAAASLAGPAVAGALAATGGTSGGSTAPAGTTAAAGIRPTGVATWFGPGFYGKQTACGQTLTPRVIGVANRTLPCGTLVQVTYSGRTLTIPVLDRGPYGHGASWDLTAGAARALGVSETVRIATHVVGRAANTSTLGLPPEPPASASGGALAG
jgi:rare lipoprotein A (peptidoglycan hydrolase)